jgi:hypothetical protein
MAAPFIQTVPMLCLEARKQDRHSFTLQIIPTQGCTDEVLDTMTEAVALMTRALCCSGFRLSGAEPDDDRRLHDLLSLPDALRVLRGDHAPE